MNAVTHLDIALPWSHLALQSLDHFCPIKFNGMVGPSFKCMLLHDLAHFVHAYISSQYICTTRVLEIFQIIWLHRGMDYSCICRGDNACFGTICVYIVLRRKGDEKMTSAQL